MKLYLERQLYPFFRMEAEEDLLLGLLQKEIAINRLICDMEDFGVDTSAWHVDLGPIILALVGFRDWGDDIFNWFLEKLNELSEQVNEEKCSSSEAALELYHALKQKRQEG